MQQTEGLQFDMRAMRKIARENNLLIRRPRAATWIISARVEARLRHEHLSSCSSI